MKLTTTVIASSITLIAVSTTLVSWVGTKDEAEPRSARASQRLHKATGNTEARSSVKTPVGEATEAKNIALFAAVTQRFTAVHGCRAVLGEAVYDVARAEFERSAMSAARDPLDAIETVSAYEASLNKAGATEADCAAASTRSVLTTDDFSSPNSGKAP